MEITVLLSLDKRESRQKKDGTHPVTLRVYDPETRKRKRYVTIFSLSEKDFKNTWLTTKPRKQYKEKRQKLQALEAKAHEVANKINDFNFSDFERLMFNKYAGKTLNVNFYFQRIIETKRNAGRINSSISYKYALDCLIRFHGKPALNFKAVSVSFLEQFEKFCIEKEHKSKTTVGIYLRNLRAVFNEAIADKTISKDIYPFGKRKYQIQGSTGTKKALNREQINALFHGRPQTPEQEKAKAFWFFSYLCNGMNFKDILNLKYKNLTDETATFIRAKTERSTQKPKAIKVYLHDYAKQVIEQYGNESNAPENYVFNVLTNGLTPEQMKRQKENFIRYANQHFLKYAKSVGIEEKISTYWARHSFSTALLRKGKSVALIGEALGHTDIKTTMNYLAGFEDKDKKAIVNDLLDE